MLNQVIIMGRIANDLEIKYTKQNNAVLSFSVAVERDYLNSEEERDVDFIDCVAWKGAADFIDNYFAKGRMICLHGRLQKRSYETEDEETRYVTEVLVDQVYFTGERVEEDNAKKSSSKKSSSKKSSSKKSSSKKRKDDEDDDELPF